MLTWRSFAGEWWVTRGSLVQRTVVLIWLLLAARSVSPWFPLFKSGGVAMDFAEGFAVNLDVGWVSLAVQRSLESLIENLMGCLMTQHYLKFDNQSTTVSRKEVSFGGT